MNLTASACSVLAGISLCLAGAVPAAPPAKPPAPPPVVDVAYMSLASAGAAIRGMDVNEAGAAISDTQLWKTAPRAGDSIAWDPAGVRVAWIQDIDSRGTKAIVTAAAGETPRNAFVFSNAGVRRVNRSDALAWGLGCSNQPVIYFWGVENDLRNWPTLWAIDPASGSGSATEVFEPPAMPPDNVGGGLGGLAVSPLGRLIAFGAYSPLANDRGIVVLPLTCAAGASLPQAAADPQPLFVATVDGGEAWISDLDWSTDGRRLAVSMGSWVSYLLYPQEIWVADLDYVAGDGTEQVSLRTLARTSSGPGSFAAWAPSSPQSACDRMAFMRNGELLLLDRPRDGFVASDCAIATPQVIGGRGVGAIDWK